MACISHSTYTLHQYIDEAGLASLRSIIRGEEPLHPDDRVRIADVSSALTRELALAEGHLTRLQAHCNAVRQQITLCQSAVAPIRNLPPEILITIFEHTFEEYYSSTDVGKPPWTLAQVCCSWRDIAISARGLWTTVKYNPRLDPMNVEIMQEYLRRSGQRPLTIVLPQEYHAPVYNSILKESHRWKILHLGLISSKFASCLSSLPPGSLPQLEELYIRESIHSCDTFLQAPQLKRVCVSHYTGLSLPFMEHITHYAAPLAMTELNTLSLLPSLIFCHISVSNNHLSIVESASRLVCNSSLKHLEIRNGFEVLNRLVLPALITLCLNDNQEVPPSVIQSFIQRSSCSLTTLIIRPSRTGGIEFLRLPCLEGLVNLHFPVNVLHREPECQYIASSILSSTSILPHLSALLIEFENTVAATPIEFASWATLIDVLERRHAAGRLKTFRLLHKYYLPPWMVRDLSALSQRSGLHIEYVTDFPRFPGFFYEGAFLTREFWHQ